MFPLLGKQGRNSFWDLCPRGYEKFTPQARSMGRNNSTAARLVTDAICISLFLPSTLNSVWRSLSKSLFPQRQSVSLSSYWVGTKYTLTCFRGKVPCCHTFFVITKFYPYCSNVRSRTHCFTLSLWFNLLAKVIAYLLHSKEATFQIPIILIMTKLTYFVDSAWWKLGRHLNLYGFSLIAVNE